MDKKLPPDLLSESIEFDHGEFFDLSLDLLAVAGTDGYFKQLNTAWERTLGWTREEMLSQPFVSFVHPDDVEPTIGQLERQIQGGTVTQFENRYRCKDGTYKWLEWSSAEQSDGLIFAVARDKTEHKRAQFERDRFFNLSIDLLVIANTDGTFRTVNERWQEIFGWNESEMISRPFFDFIHPDDIEPTEKEFERQKKGERAIRFENRYRCKNGAYRWLEWTTMPEPDGTIYAVAQDVTARREAQRALVEAHLQAEEASQAKSEFMSMVSHELRTPLTSILGSLKFLEFSAKENMADSDKELIDLAVRNAERLTNLVNDLLDLDKIQSGHLDIKKVPVEVPKLVHQALEANSGYARNLGVTIEIDGREPPATVIGDEGRLLQVLSNLLSNASKFSPDGGTVKLAWKILAGGEVNSGAVQISVSDQGTGIPDSFRPKLFTPFEQADSSSTRNISGTGLGLSICKIIVDRHDGEISFESEDGEGTTFYVTLPTANV